MQPVLKYVVMANVMILQEKQKGVRLAYREEERLADISLPSTFLYTTFPCSLYRNCCSTSYSYSSRNTSKNRTIQSHEWILNPYFYLK